MKQNNQVDFTVSTVDGLTANSELLWFSNAEENERFFVNSVNDWGLDPAF